MNLDELRSVQAKERRKDSLQHLRDAFYDDVAAYVADLREARDERAASVENPFADDEVRRLSDEIETAEEVSEALYERRVGKVVKLASFAAADMPVEREGMTSQERELFTDLVARIEGNKDAVLGLLAGDGPPAASPENGDPSSTEPRTGEGPAAGTSPSEAGGVLADAMGTDADAMGGDADAGDEPDDSATPPSDAELDGPAASESDGSPGTSSSAGATTPTPVEPEEAPPGAPGATAGDAGGTDGSTTDQDGEPSGETGEPSGETNESSGETDEPTGVTSDDAHDRTTVRITRDVGEIFGVDEREYDLSSEDVVTLPSPNAEPLIERDAAERID